MTASSTPTPRRSSLRGWLGRSPVTIGTVATLIVLFIAAQGTALRQGVPVGYDSLSMWLLLSAPEVALGQVWRIFTHALIHLSVAHLVMNCLLIVFIGTSLERLLGWWRFSLLYLSSVLGGAAAVLWLSPLTLTAGASGAAYGLMGALVVVLGPRAKAARGAWVLIIVNIGFSLIVPGVSLVGHLGGLVAGLLATAVLIQLPRALFQGGQSKRLATSVSLAAVSVVIIGAVVLCIIGAKIALATFGGFI